MMREHPHKGFTLIELLVVIGIITILVAMLIPMLASAKEIARFVACKSNMKQAGTAWNGFAVTHGDRYPGNAVSIVDGGDVCWMVLLDREWFHGNDPKSYTWTIPPLGPIVRYWNFWDPVYYPPTAWDNLYLKCPDYRGWSGNGSSNMWARSWIANDHAVAGHYYYDGGYDLADPKSGFFQDGVVVPDRRIPSNNYNSRYTSSFGVQCIYVLGRRVDTWANPSYKYLMWEAEAGNDMDRYEGPANGPGTMQLNDNPNFAPWCAGGGEQAFRHLLPSDHSLWQVRARAPVLYVDGHVGEWNPNLPQYTAKNFDPGA